MKKIKVLFVAICIAVLSLFCLPACTTYTFDLYNDDYTEWYAENGCMGFTTTLSDYCAYGYIVINGVTVRAYYGQSTPYGYRITIDYDEVLDVDEEPSLYAYDSYSIGCYHASFNGSMEDGIFSVKAFSICGIEFPAFKLYSKKVDGSISNAMDYGGCRWSTEDNSIFIDTITACNLDVKIGTISLNGESIPIHFKWCDNNRFEIYNGEDNLAERLVLASGTYTNDILNLALTFEYDDTFGLQGQTVNLTGTVIE